MIQKLLVLFIHFGPKTAFWLQKAMNEGSKVFFDKPSCTIGEGRIVPFMAMLGKQFPKAQFAITGVLVPSSNAHRPNEFLHIPYAKKLKACVSFILNNFRT